MADADPVEDARIGAFVTKLFDNPKDAEANAALGNGKMAAVMTKLYPQFVTLPSAHQAFGTMFRDLGQPGNLPALFHCTSGKDRTGWAAAALLTLLGVPEEIVFEDFMRSNEYFLRAHQEDIDEFVKAGGDSTILRAILSVQIDYLKAGFAEMKNKYGTIENYFSLALGIDGAGQKALRKRLLTGG